MLDIKVIRENLDWSKKKLATRGIKPEELDELVEIDTKRRKDLTKSEQLKAKRNDVSKQIAEKKRNKEDASDAIAAMREVGKEIKDLDKEVDELTEKQNYILLRLPNFPADSDPVGPDDSYNEEVRKWEEPTKFDFKPKAHWDIGTDLGILDWDRAAKVSGARFVYYIGAGALLERAVFNFFLDENTKDGYTEVIPPYLVNDASMQGTGQFPKFHEDVYTIVDNDDPDKPRDLTLIPTAEVPLVNYFRNEIIHGDKLPINVTALSPAFRSEAGSAGRDTRGLIRMHEFRKVEMVKVCKPDESWDELEKLTHNKELTMDFKHTTKRQLYYDQVIEFYQKTGYSAYKIEKLGIVPLKRKAIHNWIVNFVAENGKITSQTSMQSKESQTNEELDALKAEVAELKEQLRIEKLRNRLNEKIIDIAEERWHIEIRKKAGTKQ